MKTDDREAKEVIVQITNEMFQLGMLTCTGGNVSAKSEDGETIWITPSQLYKGNLKEDDLVRIRADGSTVEGSRPPSVEWQMHFGCYAARPETKGAIHTHSPIATAAGIVNALPFPPINTDAVFLRDTQLVPWFMPGSKELADAVHEAIKMSRGCILQNHGLMAVDKTLRKAANRVMNIEETAKIMLYCRQFGGELTLLPSEWAEKLASFADFI
jgi:ribulose-5-phosphate 4-epimerase/fuculose-1-phosphate aldolase